MLKVKSWITSFLGLNFYTSELDQFLIHFDQTHAKLSRSQQKEVTKYKRIHCLRDKANVVQKNNVTDLL